jgi:hypothetical protein
MAHPPFPKRIYPTPDRPAPFFRDQAPGFMGIAVSPGPVIATSASAGPPTPEMLQEPPEREQVPVPLQAPGEINPLFEPPRNSKAPPPKPNKATKATQRAREKREEELRKRRFAPAPAPSPPQPPLQPARNAKAPPPKLDRVSKAVERGRAKREEELKKRRVPPPRPQTPPRREEFQSFTANKRQMSRIGRDRRDE